MAGGPILPSSIYLGGASGNLSPTFYVPATNTNTAGAIEGVAVAASLAADAVGVYQFNLPETLPTGTLKCRVLAWANASAGVAKVRMASRTARESILLRGPVIVTSLIGDSRRSL